jgi:hypothetical protein
MALTKREMVHAKPLTVFKASLYDGFRFLRALDSGLLAATTAVSACRRKITEREFNEPFLHRQTHGSDPTRDYHVDVARRLRW